jgi:hypothetical protein
MFEGVKVVVVTPAGRRQYLKILFKYILKLRPVIDEYRLWVNTTNIDDINFMKEFQSKNTDFVILEYLPPGINVDTTKTICQFFKNCMDANTIYVRFDDDIVYIDNIDAFSNFLRFRKEHPEHLLVFGNIINNAICTHLHQRHGILSLDGGISGYKCTDDIGWWASPLSPKIHSETLSINDFSMFYMPNWKLFYNERVSINVISWLGSEFASFNGVIDSDEENYLACELPKIRNKPSIIFGNFVCVHYAFAPQRQILDQYPQFLNEYLLRSDNL